jgi:hypothetical protein
MGLEAATYIHELVATNPVGATDTKAQGDDHIRLLKTTLQNTFPNVDGAVTSSHAELNILDGVTASAAELNILDGVTTSAAELNFVDGVTSNIQTQLNTKLATNGDGSALTNLNASNLASGTVSNDRLPAALAAGAYTPTLTNIVNATSIGLLGARYSRVGNIVTVSGSFGCTPFATATNTVIDISLPIASDLLANDADGVCWCTFGGAAALVGQIAANSSGNVMRLNFISNTASPTSGFVTFVAQYIIR